MGERDSRTFQAEQPKITKLIIEKDRDMTGTNQSTGQVFALKVVTISRNESNPNGYEYYQLRDLSGTRAVSISMRGKDQIKDVELPENMLRRMAEFLASQNRRDGMFDCFSFVHAVNDIPYEYSKFDKSRWHESKYNEKITPGETIIIEKFRLFKREYTHMAIYLGDDLYISKFGNAGPLIVGDLEEMKKGFGGDRVYKLKPVRKQ